MVPGEPAAETQNVERRVRRERLERADAPRSGSGAHDGHHRGRSLTTFGAGLLVTAARGKLQIECVCGHVFGDATSSWKDCAASHRIEADELPPGIVVHSTLELMEYLCPSCGRRHSLDVKERDAAPLHDLAISAWPNSRLWTCAADDPGEESPSRPG